MTNPYKINLNNNNISKEDRESIKRAFDSLIEKIDGNKCLSDYVDINSIKSFNDLKNFIGKFDLNILLDLTIAKVSEFSPTNFNDFLQYLNQTNILLSCLWPEVVKTIDNTKPPSKSFKYDIPFESLIFDFFADFRKLIYDAGEKLICTLVSKFFLKILDVVDCNSVNKCVVPCDPEYNPFRNFFVSIKLKQGKDINFYFDAKIKKYKLSETKITNETLKIGFNDAFLNMTPAMIQCLLSGFKNTDIVKFISNIFNSINQTSEDYTGIETIINDIIDDLPDLVDVIPAEYDLLPVDACGFLSIEDVTKAQLIRSGYSSERADEIIEQTINNGRESLQTIVGFISNNPFSINPFSQIASPNSLIVKAVINRSLDDIFDAIDSNRLANLIIYKNTLINPIGEIIIGYYSQFKDSIYKKNIPQNILEYFDSQITYPNRENFYNNPLSFLTNASSNFYEKYGIPEYIESFVINYKPDSSIEISSNIEEIFLIKKDKINDIQSDVDISLNYEQDLLEYVQMVERNDVYNILEKENHQLLKNYFNIELEKISRKIYKNINEFLNRNVEYNFYFEQYYNEQYSIFNKTNFSNLDFFNIDVVKQRIKEKVRV